MAKNLFFGNTMPTPLSPVNTGDAKADDAIRKLQGWTMSPHTPAMTPNDEGYAEAVKAAGKVGPEKLLALLDDAAIAAGTTAWSDDHLDSLGAADKKAFRKHYDAVLDAIAVRRAYLAWLVGAVCRTPAGLKRSLEAVRTGATEARVVIARVLTLTLTTPEEKKAFAAALDPTAWDGKDRALERIYSGAVTALSSADPAAAFDRFAPLVTLAAVQKEEGLARAEAVILGLRGTKNPDPRWAKQLVPMLQTQLDNAALIVLHELPPDPVVREAVCAYLPKPTDPKRYWNQMAVKVLARIADRSSLPWLVAALKASWMNWPAAFEGFRVAGDPAMVNVIREWMKDNDADDRRPVAKAVIRELEAKGPVPEAGAALFAPEPKGKRARPTLTFKKTKPFKAPKLDPLAKQTKELNALFAKAGLAPHAATVPQRALWMIPTRVDETKLKALGGTKLGGHPDLDAKAEWPRFEGEPLTFLAQVNLAEVAKLLPKGVLPKDGLLSFFVGDDPHSEVAGYCEHGVVLHTPAKAKLARKALPDDFVSHVYQAATVKLHEAWTLPAANNQRLTKLLKKPDVAKYEEGVLFDQHLLPQLLGFRNHGYDAEMPATAQMLLQLPGDPQTDMEFGDVEALSFFVDAKRLAKGDFSSAMVRLGD